MAENWNLKGTYFEACNCEAACPCIFLSPPTTGECTVFVAWHIDEGRHGSTSLDGLNVALAVDSPGHMTEGKWKVALYLDDRASEEQQGVLGQIFGGQAGGHFEILAGHIGEVVGVSTVPIEYNANGKERSIRIPNVSEIDIEGIGGAGGEIVTVSNNPLGIVPGVPPIVARSSKLTYKDHGMDWNISGKNAFYSDFTYAG